MPEYAGTLYDTESAAQRAALVDWLTATGIEDDEDVRAEMRQPGRLQELVEELIEDMEKDVWDLCGVEADPEVIEHMMRAWLDEEAEDE